MKELEADKGKRFGSDEDLFEDQGDQGAKRKARTKRGFSPQTRPGVGVRGKGSDDKPT